MQLQSPFGVITPTLDGDDWFTISAINNMLTGRSHEGVRRVLARLVAAGIVDEQVAGRTKLHRLNREHLAAPAIIEIAGLRRTFLDRVRDELESWDNVPTYAALFGSAATGEMSGLSDVDIFLLKPSGAAPRWEEQVHALTLVASRWTGNDVRIFVLSDDEVRGQRDLQPVLGDISDHGVAILGDPIAFRRLIATR